MGIAQLTAGSIELANRAVTQIAEDIFDPTNRRPAVYDEFCASDTVGGEMMIEHQVLEALAPIRKWVGERQFRDVVFAIVRGYKETYEKSHEIDRKRARTLTGEQLQTRLVRWLGSPEIDLDKIVHDVTFLGGTGPTCYDGVALFSASHPRGKDNAVQSNTSATAWSVAQHEAVMLAGAALTDAYGENIGIGYDTIVVGAKLARQLRDFLKPDRVQALSAAGVEATASVVAATTGPSAKGLTVYEGGAMRLIIDPRFSIGSTLESKYLYLDTSKGVKPMHLYRGESFLTSRTAPETDNAFYRDVLQWGVTHDIIMVPGAWQVAFFGGV